MMDTTVGNMTKSEFRSMENTLRKNLCFLLFFGFLIVRLRGEDNNLTPLTKSENVEKENKTHNEVVVNDKKRNNGGGGGGVGWGWGGGGGGANSRGGWGWGNGGGGGVYWRWGCGAGKRGHKKRSFSNEDYRIGQFAQCMVKGRCKGMRLDCPLHCGGPCFYDCRHMCKAHCKR